MYIEYMYADVFIYMCIYMCICVYISVFICAHQAQMRHQNLILALSATAAASALLIGFTLYDAAEMLSIGKEWVEYNIAFLLTIERGMSMMWHSKILWNAASVSGAWLVRLQYKNNN